MEGINNRDLSRIKVVQKLAKAWKIRNEMRANKDATKDELNEAEQAYKQADAEYKKMRGASGISAEAVKTVLFTLGL